jgi:hypothetical protein
MVKIKLECWWTDSASLNKRLIKQFVNEKDLGEFSFVDENPDYTIVFGNTEWDKIQTTKEKTFYFSQEPSWSPNQPTQSLHDYCSKIFISDKRIYEEREEYIETLLPMFYGGRGETDYREEWDWSKKLFDINYYQNKNKTISTVVTNSYNSHFFQFQNSELNRIIYKDRVDIVNKIIYDQIDVDVWGTYQPINEKNLHGEAWNKLISLKDFKFSICFENTIQKNYISEKFWDCVLTDTVPIYFGCSNIDEYINEDCFFNLTNYIDDYTYVKTQLNFILENSDFLYEKYVKNLRKLKQEYKINQTYNLWEKIKKEILQNEKNTTDDEVLG